MRRKKSYRHLSRKENWIFNLILVIYLLHTKNTFTSPPFVKFLLLLCNVLFIWLERCVRHEALECLNGNLWLFSVVNWAHFWNSLLWFFEFFYQVVYNFYIRFKIFLPPILKIVKNNWFGNNFSSILSQILQSSDRHFPISSAKST